MSKRNVPLNKGNYSMDVPEREARFEACRGEGWESEYSEYRRNWTEYAEGQTVSNYPLLVDIELASVCNLHCPMCYTITDEFKQKVNTKLMDWDLYQKIIDEVGGKVPAIRLSLRGEATLHPKFIECISYAKKLGVKEVSTLTHGGKLTPDYFEKMVDAGIDWITISVDGLDKTYDEIRKPLKSTELLDKLKFIKQFKEERRIPRPVIKVQSIWPAIKKNPQEFYNAFVSCSDLVAFNPLIDYLSNDTKIDYLEDFTCPQQYQRLVIGADGLVMKCSNDEENQEVIGDVNHETVHQIWHGESMREVRQMHLMPQGFMQSSVCRKCYLPRVTEEEEVRIDDRSFIVKNYSGRSQEIGE
jgi:radical SAM protein with 4Fe4S-binding SPASM domain